MVGQELVKLEFWFGSSLVSQAQDRLDPQRPEHHQPEGHLSPPHHCSPRLLTGPTLGLCIQLWVKSSTASTSFHSNLYSARDRLSLTSTAAVKAQEIAPIGKKLSSAVHVKLLRLCLTLWDHMDYNPRGCSVCGVFQARILERVAMAFPGGSSWPRDGTHVSCVSCSSPLAPPVLNLTASKFCGLLE